jgi:serine/threonine-protein kinase
MTVAEGRRGSWNLAEGEEFAPGRSAVRLLGGGKRYEVYLAWDDQLLSLVVAKILRPSLVGDHDARASMASEAAILRDLQHPVIVRAFDVVMEGRHPHLLLEYVEGPRLSTLIRTSSIALDQAFALGLQLSAAAHYMSSRDIFHLDIKPQNIIMAGPSRLIDLSIAKRATQVSTISSPIGTTRLMAPEQCDPSRYHEIGPATDVWGIGMTLYWTLAKRLPFPPPAERPEAPPEARYPQLAQSPAPLPEDVPPALAELVGEMLLPQPWRRPAAREVLDVLEPLFAALPRPRLGRFRVPSKTALQY